MKISKFIPITISLFIIARLCVAQTDRTIYTAMSYLLTRPDARTSAMGDAGAAMPGDAYSIYANPSKIAFGQHSIEAGLSYIPLMRNLSKDVSLANFSGFKKLNEGSALGMSVYYLSYGKIDGMDLNGNFTQSYYPSEFTFDLTYARKMSNNFSMGLTGRYLHSNTRFEESNNTLVPDPAKAIAADISVYYRLSTTTSHKDWNWAFGAMISNLGTKLQYTDKRSYFLPANLKLGAAYVLFQNPGDQKLIIALDLNKLLVPSPPEYDNNGEIVNGQDPDRSVVSALFSSFSDAPGGFSEELSEISIGTGLEYLFSEAFALRTGYFHESPEKGNRSHFTFGTGLKSKNFNLDLAYVIPAANRFILSNNLKFSIGFNLR